MPASEIRPLLAEDWAAYRDLRLRALAGAPDAFGQTLAVALEYDDERWRELASDRDDGHPEAACLVLDGAAGGLVASCSVRLTDDPSVARVFAMWVDLDQRGRQLGGRLLDAAEAWARSRDAPRLLLHVTRGNPAAERLYERAGYTPTGEEQPLREGSSRVAVELGRDLTAG